MGFCRLFVFSERCFRSFFSMIIHSGSDILYAQDPQSVYMTVQRCARVSRSVCQGFCEVGSSPAGMGNHTCLADSINRRFDSCRQSNLLPVGLVMMLYCKLFIYDESTEVCFFRFRLHCPWRNSRDRDRTALSDGGYRCWRAGARACASAAVRHI